MNNTLILTILFLFVIVFFSGCVANNQGEDDLKLYKGIPSAEIPGACLESKNDVCDLFDCMVDLCWCEKSPNAILYEKQTTIDTENGAINLVKEYLKANKIDYNTIKAVKLNNIFFNIFTYDKNNDEKVFTVAVDGTIIKTQCGV